jgi:Xaa-Pro aminopeptidase
MKTGHIVVNDCGGESVLGYAGDITRTIPVSGKFDQKQKDIYSIVLKTQLRAIDAIEPGIKFLDIHILAAETITAGLIDLDLMRGDPKEAVNAGAHALFFPHGLGHMLGLDVHDMENLGEKYVGYNEQNQRSEQFGLRYLRFAKELKTGHVITVEPGIYFIPELIDLWEGEQKFIQFINYEKVREYRSFGGVRIEDDVLVTDSSGEVLGRSIPKTIEEVEALTSV